jgi:hypothetical protein
VRIKTKQTEEVIMTETPNPASAPVEGKKKTPKVKAADGEDKPKVARPRLPKLPEDHVITVLKPNAKSGKSGERFDQYKTGMTVKAYIDIMTKEPFNRSDGEVWGDIRWDIDPERQLIHIGPTVVDVPPPPPPKEPKAKKKLEVVPGTQPAA